MLGLPQWLSGTKIHLQYRKLKEIQVRSLGWEDLVEEGMATHSSILAWRVSWTEKPCGLQSIGSQRVRHNLSD